MEDSTKPQSSQVGQGNLMEMLDGENTIFV